MTQRDVFIARECNPERSDHEHETRTKTIDLQAIGIRSSMKQIKIHRDHADLMTRLQYVTASSLDPEMGKAWRNRMIVRSRLKRYVSYH
jgi:hypothetical protein